MADSDTKLHIKHGVSESDDQAGVHSAISFAQLSFWVLLSVVCVGFVLIQPKFNWSFSNDGSSIETQMPDQNPDLAPVKKIYPEYAPGVFPTISPQKTGSIAPTDIEPGITILSRSDEIVANGTIKSSSLDAPIAAGADIANGFAISLGEAQAFSSLSKRFGRIAKMNAAIFRALEPRAIFVESERGLRARLVAGPFATRGEADTICRILHLPTGLSCQTQAFDGDLIARQ